MRSTFSSGSRAHSFAMAWASAPVLLLAALASQGRAQAVGSIAGTVQDSAGKGIPGVEVSIAAPRTVVRSDTLGHFRMANVPAGAVDVHFRRIGFEPKTEHASVGAGATERMTVALDVLALELPGVLVASETRKHQILHDFYERLSLGFGQFITRAEIEKQNPMTMSDMMRRIPGAVLIPSSIGNRATLRFARSSLPGRDCPPQYWVDGVRAFGFNIDDVEPMDVEGIEIYQGPSGLPPQYNTRDGTTICGTVLIWTRVPG